MRRNPHANRTDAGALLVAADTPVMTQASIEVDSCLYLHNAARTRYGYRVTFVNVSNTTATSVRCHVRWPGLDSDQYLRDDGSFAPGVTISHTFAAPEIFSTGWHCNVVEARFDDGTTWTAGLEDQ
jgi:hypothetical protein